MKKIKPKTALAVGNRTDPYLTLGAGTVQSDRFWRWGDDNLFPRRWHSCRDRPPAHHQRQGRLHIGQGRGLRHGLPLLARFIETVNSDGGRCASCST